MRSDLENATNGIGVSSHTHGRPDESQRESKLELFGFDSLVNILGLKRYVMKTLCLVLFAFYIVRHFVG